jgi:hypothetical protein
VLLHENGHAIDSRYGISNDDAVISAWESEAYDYLDSLPPHKEGEPLGQRYYARKLEETVAQGISILHGREFGVEIKDSAEFEATFPKTMAAIRAQVEE